MITLKNVSKITINLNFSKEYKGIGKSLILASKESISGFPDEIKEEKEVKSREKKGIIKFISEKKQSKAAIPKEPMEEKEVIEKEEMPGIDKAKNDIKKDESKIKLGGK